MEGREGDGALAGKAILITGAGRGLGRAYALDAARHGAKVMVADVDPVTAADTAAAIEAAGGTAGSIAGSVADWDEAGAQVAATVDAFGAIDGLVNNAGVLPIGAPWDNDEAALRAVVEVNLLGTMFCGVQAMRRMRERGGGAIVNVTSGTHLGLYPDLSAYGATKGGVASLTYGWATHGAEAGIRVNAISPLARTPMEESFSKDKVIGPPPEVVAPAVSYLLSDRAAAVNGQIVRVDGSALSLLRRPAYSTAKVEGEHFTFEEIAAAFDRGELGPLSG